MNYESYYMNYEQNSGLGLGQVCFGFGFYLKIKIYDEIGM